MRINKAVRLWSLYFVLFHSLAYTDKSERQYRTCENVNLIEHCTKCYRM